MLLIKNSILRKLFLGFIQVHILHHANKGPFFGAWMIEELKEHGYTMSPGTLYPVLHSLETAGLLVKEEQIIEGKIRKYYAITAKGVEVLAEAKQKAEELIKEISD